MKSIWHKNATLEMLDQMSVGTMVEHLGIIFKDIGSNCLVVEMKVDERTNPAELDKCLHEIHS